MPSALFAASDAKSTASHQAQPQQEWDSPFSETATLEKLPDDHLNHFTPDDLPECDQALIRMLREEKEDVENETLNVHNEPKVLLPDTTFNQGAVFIINATGITRERFPGRSFEYDIPIFHEDGKLAYTMKRQGWTNGQGRLIAEDSSKVSAAHMNLPDIKVGKSVNPVGESEWRFDTISHRRMIFTDTRNGTRYMWSYVHTRMAGQKSTLLQLTTVLGKKDPGQHLMAQLIRTNVTRTPGSKKSSKGNGGRLVLRRDADDHIPEHLIIITCLKMLKSEVDHRRIKQKAAWGAGLGVGVLVITAGFGLIPGAVAGGALVVVSTQT